MTVKKYCAFGGCKRLVNLDERYCSRHKREEQHVSKTSMYANEIHSSSRWRKTSRLYREAHPVCEACLKASKRADKRADKRAGMINLATSVDHIVPLFLGGEPYDWDNLQSLCDYHHAMKSQREREQKK
jgi:5-methylcytosine-specific restriction endonuclease McrA